MAFWYRFSRLASSVNVWATMSPAYCVSLPLRVHFKYLRSNFLGSHVAMRTVVLPLAREVQSRCHSSPSSNK